MVSSAARSSGEHFHQVPRFSFFYLFIYFYLFCLRVRRTQLSPLSVSPPPLSPSSSVIRIDAQIVQSGRDDDDGGSSDGSEKYFGKRGRRREREHRLRTAVLVGVVLVLFFFFEEVVSLMSHTKRHVKGFVNRGARRSLDRSTPGIAAAEVEVAERVESSPSQTSASASSSSSRADDDGGAVVGFNKEDEDEMTDRSRSAFVDDRHTVEALQKEVMALKKGHEETQTRYSTLLNSHGEAEARYSTLLTTMANVQNEADRL